MSMSIFNVLFFVLASLQCVYALRLDGQHGQLERLPGAAARGPPGAVPGAAAAPMAAGA